MQPEDTKDNLESLSNATIQALETMAFFCAEPSTADDALPPENALRVEMDFAGPVSGTVSLVAGKHFGQRLASNALGCGVNDEDAVTRAEDSIRELINIVAGMIMPNFATSPADVFNLSLPRTSEFDLSGWDELAAGTDACFIDAEGDSLAVTIRRKSA
jgi:hypothetical protein